MYEKHVLLKLSAPASLLLHCGIGVFLKRKGVGEGFRMHAVQIFCTNVLKSFIPGLYCVACSLNVVISFLKVP